MNMGCNNCKNYNIGKIQMYKDNIPRSCYIGNNDKFELWWKENGNKRNENDLTDMDCFEATSLQLYCNRANEILDDLKRQ